MSEKETPRPIGYIEVVIYAGLPGAKPVEAGTVRIPAYLCNLVGQKPFHLLLDEAITYTGESLKAIFRELGEKTDDGN